MGHEQTRVKKGSKASQPPDIKSGPVQLNTNTHQSPLMQHYRDLGNEAVQRMMESGAIQAKLTIGQPNDKYEQEADRVADQVMRMPEPKQSLVNGHSSLVQRQATCPECMEEEEDIIQTKQARNQVPAMTSDIETGISALKGGGQLLSQSARAFFEPRFGRDFQDVRVHTDNQAAKIANAVYARAFTLGRDIVFGAGLYQPRTSEGKRLLAHELTHVVQQNHLQPLDRHLAGTDSGHKLLSNEHASVSRKNKSSFAHNSSCGPIDVTSKMRAESIQREIAPHPEISGAFIITVSSTINNESDFISQVSSDLGSRVIPGRVPTLMSIDRFRERLRACWNSVLSLRRPGRRQIIVRLEGWGGVVSRFVLIAPEVELPGENQERGEPTLPALTAPPQEESGPTAEQAGIHEESSTSIEEPESQQESVYMASRRLFVAFLLGTRLYELLGRRLHGPLQDAFGPSHPWTQRMRQHQHLDNVRVNIRSRLEEYCRTGAGVLYGHDSFNLNNLSVNDTITWLGSDILNWMSLGMLGQESAYIYGSFRLYWAIRDYECTGSNISANVLFVASDLLHLRSAARVPLTVSDLPEQPLGEGMPLNDVPISWYWNENWISVRPILITQ
jgi:hypothetical protein